MATVIDESGVVVFDPRDKLCIELEEVCKYP